MRRHLLRALLSALLVLPATSGPALAVEPDDVTGDITKPTLLNLTVQPTTVDVTQATATLEVTVRLGDAGSGVDLSSSSFGWSSSSGTLNTSAFFTLVSGDQHDGTYMTTMTVPAGAPAGAWPLSVQVQDRVGNWLRVQRGDLEAAGLPGHVDVIDHDPDLTAPQVVEVQLSAHEVDVLAGPATIGLRVRLRDEKSGAVMPYVIPRSPHPQGGPGGIRPPILSLVEGTPQDGWWEGLVEVPRYAHSGEWSLDIRTYDVLLNSEELTGDQLAERGDPTGFGVVSEQDVTPPAITAAAIAPLALDVSDADGEIRLEATMVDDLSGVEESHGTPYLSFAMHHPIGQWQGSPRVERLTGTSVDGTYAATLTIPESSATGLWPLHLGVMDAIGNSHSLSPVELTELGLPPAVLVYNTPLPPLNVTVDPADAAAVVGWDPPADERGAEVIEYLVRELPDGKVVRADASAREVVVPGLTNDMEHRFAVYAVNRAGESDPSTTVTAQPSAALAPPPAPESDAAVLRLHGRDRVETAVAASRSGWLGGTAGAVVLTRADDYADALSGTPLAAAHDAPLLLTAGSALDGRTRAEIVRVLPAGRTVHVLGGERAVGRAVVQGLRDAGYAVVRVAGTDRYATATAVARQVTASPQVVLLATGRSYADALGAGVAAASARGVVLLTDGARMPAATASYLAEHGAPRFAVGGPAAAADPGATPISGRDRYETALLTSRRFPARENLVGIATGEGYADALSGGAHAVRTGASLLLTPRLALPEAVAEHLRLVGVRGAFAYGGPAVVDSRVLTRLESIVSG